MEQRYFQNLSPFILSGKFKQLKIPDLIVFRMLGYFIETDIPMFEKCIMNLDMSTYDKNLEILHMCEMHFLTSGIMYMLTTLYDKDNENTVCL